MTSVAYSHECLASCPVTVADELIAVVSAMGWDMTRGYLLPSIACDAERGAPIRGEASLTAADARSEKPCACGRRQG